MESITERFIIFYGFLLENKLVKNQKDFYQKIGKKADSSILTEIKKGRSNLGLETLQSTVFAFPQLNCNWIITGNGDMIIQKTQSPYNLMVAEESIAFSKSPELKEILQKLDVLTKKVNEIQEQQPPRKRTSA